MAVGNAHVFHGFLTPVLTQLFFPKPPTTFRTCFCRGERRKYAGKKVRLNRESNSQPPGHESDTLTTEPPRQGRKFKKRRVLVNGIDRIWASDLVDMQAFSKFNRGVKYFLAVIDVFSKYGWLIPLKDKTGKSVASALEPIFKERKPEKM